MPEKFYVGVKQARELRREILVATKSLLEILKKEHELKKIRQEKLDLAKGFKNALDELAAASRKLKAKLPRLAAKKPTVPARQAKEEKAKEAKPAKAREKPKPARKSKVQLLEEELAAVEQRLKELE